MMFAFVGVSSPQFVVALLLLYVFAAHLGWFPMSGYGTPAHVVLPALTLGLLGAGWYARMVRSAMIDVLNQDYVRTARAKGLSRPRVVLRHALPNALLPIVAMIGIDIGQFMGGVVVVEAVYGWPGIGQLGLAGDPAGGRADHYGRDARLLARDRARQSARRSRSAAA